MQRDRLRERPVQIETTWRRVASHAENVRPVRAERRAGSHPGPETNKQQLQHKTIHTDIS
jgi:hypothetical protein